MIVNEKPQYLVKDITIALAMAYKTNGKVEQIIYEGTFIGYGVIKNGELL